MSKDGVDVSTFQGGDSSSRRSNEFGHVVFLVENSTPRLSVEFFSSNGSRGFAEKPSSRGGKTLGSRRERKNSKPNFSLLLLACALARKATAWALKEDMIRGERVERGERRRERREKRRKKKVCKVSYSRRFWIVCCCHCRFPYAQQAAPHRQCW